MQRVEEARVSLNVAGLRDILAEHVLRGSRAHALRSFNRAVEVFGVYPYLAGLGRARMEALLHQLQEQARPTMRGLLRGLRQDGCPDALYGLLLRGLREFDEARAPRLVSNLLIFATGSGALDDIAVGVYHHTTSRLPTAVACSSLLRLPSGISDTAAMQELLEHLHRGEIINGFGFA
jgi:hypothetical protein